MIDLSEIELVVDPNRLFQLALVPDFLVRLCLSFFFACVIPLTSSFCWRLRRVPDKLRGWLDLGVMPNSRFLLRASAALRLLSLRGRRRGSGHSIAACFFFLCSDSRKLYWHFLHVTAFDRTTVLQEGHNLRPLPGQHALSFIFRFSRF